VNKDVVRIKDFLLSWYLPPPAELVKAILMSAKDHALALPAGYRLEGLEFTGVIGQGGFGITYCAVELSVGRRVAVKELLPESIATRIGGSTVQPLGTNRREDWDWARQRFLDEASILARFAHPAIVGVQRLIEANGTVYVVMDFIEGESLGQRWARIGREQTEKDLMELVGPLLDGIEEVHAQGLLHRDIKPDNVLVNSRGQPVLIDFGSAREAVGHRTISMTSIVSHGYSPIEQYQTRGRMGPWTDIYALGAVMYRGITGEKPPMAADRLLEDDYQSLITRGFDKYGLSVLGGIDWALRPRPEERPRTVKQWREVLTSPFEYKRPQQEEPKQERRHAGSKRPRMQPDSTSAFAEVFRDGPADSFWDKQRQRRATLQQKEKLAHFLRIASVVGSISVIGFLVHSCGRGTKPTLTTQEVQAATLGYDFSKVTPVGTPFSTPAPNPSKSTQGLSYSTDPYERLLPTNAYNIPQPKRRSASKLLDEALKETDPNR
jgi:serine/threonine protein kinase